MQNILHNLIFFTVVTDPVGDVNTFIANFEESYGDYHPTFYRGSYSQVDQLYISWNRAKHSQWDNSFEYFICNIIRQNPF